MTLRTSSAKSDRSGSPLEVLLAFGKLGVTCFGGPIAHIGYFRDEFVVRRRWLDDLGGLLTLLVVVGLAGAFAMFWAVQESKRYYL